LTHYDSIKHSVRVLLKHILLAGGAKTCVNEIEAVILNNGTRYRLPADVPFYVKSGFDVHVVGVALFCLILWATCSCCKRLCCCGRQAAGKPKTD
jgi:hypothetical protein